MPRALAVCLVALTALLAVAPAGEAARGTKAKHAARGSAVLGSASTTLAVAKRKRGRPRTAFGRFTALTRPPKVKVPAPAPVVPGVPVAAAPVLGVPVPPPTDPGETLGSFASVRARDSATSFSFTLSRPALAAGPVRLQLQNSGEDPHDLTVAPASGGAQIATTSSVAPGENGSLTATLPAGRYRLYCSLYNHAARGMQATLDVR